MYKKNKLKLITKFFNIGLLLIIPTLILTSCGAPQSQKYLTLVAQFNPLLRLPNPNLDNEQEKKFKDATMQVHYSLLKKINSRNFIQWSFGNISNNSSPYETTEEEKPIDYNKGEILNSNVDPLFSSTYGILVDSIAYKIVYPAMAFATTVSQWNKLPGNEQKQINLWNDGNDQKTLTTFYNAMSNNLMVANSEKSIGFSISDLSFKINEIISNDKGKYIAKKDDGIDKQGTIDLRQNNTLFNNDEKKVIVKNDDENSKNKINNRLTKIYMITDIDLHFRFFVSGSDKGSISPSRDTIIDNSDSENKKANKKILEESYKKLFGEDLTIFDFKLHVNDLVTTILYYVSLIKPDDDKEDTNIKEDSKPEPAKKDEYSIKVSTAYPNLLPFSLYNDEKLLGKDNVLKPNKKIMDKIIDKKEILEKEEYESQPAEENENNSNDMPITDNLFDIQNNFSYLLTTFLNTINTNKPNFSELINNPLTMPNGKVNYLKFTIEDFYKLYFNKIESDNTLPYKQNVENVEE